MQNYWHYSLLQILMSTGGNYNFNGGNYHFKI